MGKAKKKKKINIRPAWAILSGAALLVLLPAAVWYFSLAEPKLPDPPLKKLAANHRIDLGIHLKADRLDDKVYPDLASSQFSDVIIDGGIHFKQLHPSPDRSDFSAADKIVDYAQANDMPVQLHHLVWGDDYMLPKWLTEGNYTKEQILDILHKHIQDIVGRYKGRVAEYTVVNEAFTEGQHVYGLRNWWADHIGNDDKYLDQFFIWAHQADPGAKLILNDFNNETKNSVSDAIYDYVKGAKTRGVPIDAIGMQLHIDASRPPKKQDVINNMNRFKALGVDVYVTEFDVNTSAVKADSDFKNRLESQITYDIARACIESQTCKSFAVFGLTRKSRLVETLTLAKPRDYIFDSNFKPRQSFYSFRQAWLDP